MAKVIEASIAATVHGRYLVVPPDHPGPAPLLAGFHGYAEDAEAQLARLRAIPESNRWLCVSIQALHRFYERRSSRVVASWMTRQNRDEAIADNVAYVAACLKAVSAAWPVMPGIVFAGFSQGVAMAFRSAANTAGDVAVIAVGGDVPPELEPPALQRISAALMIRGVNDTLYNEEQFVKDQRRLPQSCALEFDAGHEWSTEMSAAAGRFLRDRHPQHC
jgi:poly(3-hydroxybutyrate) depolymerase